MLITLVSASKPVSDSGVRSKPRKNSSTNAASVEKVIPNPTIGQDIQKQKVPPNYPKTALDMLNFLLGKSKPSQNANPPKKLPPSLTKLNPSQKPNPTAGISNDSQDPKPTSKNNRANGIISRSSTPPSSKKNKTPTGVVTQSRLTKKSTLNPILKSKNCHRTYKKSTAHPIHWGNLHFSEVFATQKLGRTGENRKGTAQDSRYTLFSKPIGLAVCNEDWISKQEDQCFHSNGPEALHGLQLSGWEIENIVKPGGLMIRVNLEDHLIVYNNLTNFARVLLVCEGGIELIHANLSDRNLYRHLKIENGFKKDVTDKYKDIIWTLQEYKHLKEGTRVVVLPPHMIVNNNEQDAKKRNKLFTGVMEAAKKSTKHLFEYLFEEYKQSEDLIVGDDIIMVAEVKRYH